MDAEEVIAFLKANPSFLASHPELLTVITPPDNAKGEDNILDFQSYAMSALQEKLQASKEQIGEIVAVSRDNHSIQSQVQNAVLTMMSARTLERFLEVLCIDIPTIFALDVVRLGLESDTPNPYESYYPEDYYSGMVLIGEGACDFMFEGREKVWLVADNLLDAPDMAECLFMECGDLARSSVYMQLQLKHVDRAAVMAFGTRTKGRFADGQGTELLQFLAQATSIKLDQLLYEQAGLL